MHTTGDTIAPAFHESAYAAGASELLMQQFTRRFVTAAGERANGHCTLTSVQDLAGIDAMVH